MSSSINTNVGLPSVGRARFDSFQPALAAAGDQELASTFQKAVAGMFFGQMMQALRSTVGEPAYIHGGQAEKMFQSQMDQYVVEDLAENSGAAFVGDLYRQFRVQLGLPVESPATSGSGRFNADAQRDRFASPLLGGDSLQAASPAGAAVELATADGVNPSNPENSTQATLASVPADSSQISRLLEAVREARTVSIPFPDTTPTAALGSMFRK